MFTEKLAVAKRKGMMTDGRVFCSKGNMYEYEVRGNKYFVTTELCLDYNYKPNRFFHEMPLFFFKQYFSPVEPFLSEKEFQI